MHTLTLSRLLFLQRKYARQNIILDEGQEIDMVSVLFNLAKTFWGKFNKKQEN